MQVMFVQNISLEIQVIYMNCIKNDKNSAEGVGAPAGAKITGATIRTWLLNKFISFLAVLSWKTGLKKKSRLSA